MTTTLENHPTIRCGVFDTVQRADDAVNALVAAGFRQDQISVLCSDQGKEEYFARFHKEDPAGTHTPEAAVAGGTLGAILGGLVSVGITTATGLSILAAGPSFLLGGAVAGSLIGAMQTRGHEGALADFYDQALTQGKLLVAVEDDSANSDARLARAADIFRHAGAAPVPLTSEF